MARHLGLTILGLVLLVPASTSLQAQEETLTAVYSKGVQAYFNGEFEQAQQKLSHAIEQGTRDPRAYYFRGLAHSELQNEAQAQADFRKGGEMEALDRQDLYPVSRSLTRIQGAVRVSIERHRLEAQRDVAALEAERRRVRYGRVQRNSAEAQRQPVDSQAPTVVIDPSTLPALPADASSQIVNPFRVDTAGLANSDLLGGANSRPASALKPSVSNPVAGAGNNAFNTSPPAATAGNTPAAVAGTPSPFAVKPTAPAAGAGEADPFGTKPAAPVAAAGEADPFGTKPAAPVAAAGEADPFGNKPAAPVAAAGEADPFGNKPAAPVAAAGEADPFANKPAAPAAGAPPKKGVFGSIFRAFGTGVTNTVTGSGEGGGKEDNVPANNPLDPFGAKEPFPPKK